MTLYHGTNEDIVSIDLTKGLRFKDFGKGFYLTPDKNTAVRMAQKKARLFGGTPTLITYDLFVDANRDRKNILPIHSYDIVVGPIADDGVVLQLTNYREGIYSPEQAAQLLQDKYLDQQYFFGTQSALKYLQKTKVEIL